MAEEHWSDGYYLRLGQRLTALNAQGEAVEAVVVDLAGLTEIVTRGAFDAALLRRARAMIAAANG